MGRFSITAKDNSVMLRSHYAHPLTSYNMYVLIELSSIRAWHCVRGRASMRVAWTKQNNVKCRSSAPCQVSGGNVSVRKQYKRVIFSFTFTARTAGNQSHRQPCCSKSLPWHLVKLS